MSSSVDSGAPAPPATPTAVRPGGSADARSGRTARWIRRRFFPPLVRQHDQSDCGPAALLSVLRFWGGDAALGEVRDLAGTDLRGTSLLGLSRAAGRLGLRARGASGEFADLASVRLPCLAHLTLENGRAHYVVLYRLSPDAVFVGDPARGRRRLGREAFEALWRHRAVLLLDPTDDLRGGRLPGWLPWFNAHLRSGHAWLVQSLFLGLTTAGLGIATALFVQWLIDRFIPERDTAMILATGLALGILLLLRAMAGYLRQRFLLALNRRVALRVNEEFLAHLFRLPLRFFESRAVGDLTARLTDGARVQGAMLEVIGSGVIDGMIVVGSFLFLFALAPPLGWVAVATMPAWFAILAPGALRIREAQGEALAAHSHVHASFVDSVRGIAAILGFGAAQPFIRRNVERYRDFQLRAERLGTIQARVLLGTELAGGLIVVIALSLGAVLVVGGELLLGQLMAGYSLLAGMIPSIQRLSQAPGAFQEAAMAAERLRELLLNPAEPAVGTRHFRPRREMRLDGIVLEWSSGERVLNGVNLALRRGEVAGLWGPNGAGKTTLLSVIQRARRPSGGRIWVDGVPMEEFSLPKTRSRIGVFSGETILFQGTLADNVTLGRDLPNQRGLSEKLEAMGFGPFLDRFPDRWATVVGEGGRRLSAGERQAVGLMRVLAHQPEVILVDEGLRGSDGALSELLLRALLDFGSAGFLLIVSHDPHVLLHTDRLFVLEAGRIVDDGIPSEVLSRRSHLRWPGSPAPACKEVRADPTGARRAP